MQESGGFLENRNFPKIIGESPKEGGKSSRRLTLKSAFEKFTSPSPAPSTDENEKETKEDVTWKQQPIKPFVLLYLQSYRDMESCCCGEETIDAKFVANTSRGVDSIMLPVPIVPVLSGGVYSGNEIPFDGIELVPVQSESYSSAIETCEEFKSELIDIEQKNVTCLWRVHELRFHGGIWIHKRCRCVANRT